MHIHIFIQFYIEVCVYTCINTCTRITLSGVTGSVAIKPYIHPHTQTYPQKHTHIFAPTFLFRDWQGRGLLCIDNTYTHLHVHINIQPHVRTYIPPSRVTGSRAIQTLTPGPFASRAVCVRHYLFICVPWLINMCDMTHAYVWHDSCICATWLIHICDMTHSYVWHDSFVCLTWLIHVCDMRLIHMYDMRLIHTCDMTHSFVSHSHRGERDVVYVTWLIDMCDMVHSYVWHDAFICETWRIQMYERHDSFKCMCDMTHA